MRPVKIKDRHYVSDYERSIVVHFLSMMSVLMNVQLTWNQTKSSTVSAKISGLNRIVLVS